MQEGLCFKPFIFLALLRRETMGVEGEKKGGNGRRLREGGDEVSEEMGARVWGRR